MSRRRTASWPDRVRSSIGYCLGQPLYRLFSLVPDWEWGLSDHGISILTHVYPALPMYILLWLVVVQSISRIFIWTDINLGMIVSSQPYEISTLIGFSSRVICSTYRRASPISFDFSNSYAPLRPCT